MAALALAEANAVRSFENETLGWREPPDDGDGRVDIYLKEARREPPVRLRRHGPGPEGHVAASYLVIDNDFDPAQYGGVPTCSSRSE